MGQHVIQPSPTQRPAAWRPVLGWVGACVRGDPGPAVLPGGTGTAPSPCPCCGPLAVRDPPYIPGPAPAPEKPHTGSWAPADRVPGPGSAGRARHLLTRFRPAGRGTQSAGRRQGRTSSAPAARPGCSQRPGLRGQRGPSATSGRGPLLTPTRAHVPWGWADPQGPAASDQAERGLEASAGRQGRLPAARSAGSPRPGKRTTSRWPLSKEGRMRRQRPWERSRRKGPLRRWGCPT